MQETMDIVVAAKILKNLKEEKVILEENFKKELSKLNLQIEEILKEF